MKINFNAKAPDVYQVKPRPTNRYDVINNVVGAICTTGMVFGFLGLAAYIYKKGSDTNAR